eukprot:Hpha_TRINITY_DN16461_c2_g12::TRINITY_DN16461_c2_g12_i1::g.160044::m.160044/K02433/gatA, QRSL1; aspartyl-tRNA(Asn)/glutamyl-tRNA(Gln) amidotransferase subunit A
MTRAILAWGLLVGVSAVPRAEVPQGEWHKDFPPRELIDVESEDWRTRVNAQNHAKIAEWFTTHAPQLPLPPVSSPRERELWRWGVGEYIEAFKAGKVTAAEYTQALLRRLEHYKGLNTHCATSYHHTNHIEEQAEAVDRKAQAEGIEAVAPWYGLPIALKGTIATTDFPSSSGSGPLDSFLALRDADSARRLREGNAVLFGKTNVPEFAASFITMNHRNGVTRNPHSPFLSAGGSSGGSGSAVAARIVPLALTEDTGGSTRHPANNNGNFGYDPPRNKYPNTGNPGMTPWHDQIGVNTRSMEEILLFDQIFTGLHAEHAAARQAAASEAVRVGFPEEYFQRYTIPAKATNVFGVISCRAAKPVRDALAAAKAHLATSGFDVVKNAEWGEVENPVLGKVNSIYEVHFGHKVSGQHFEPFMGAMQSYAGGIAAWTEQYLGVHNISAGDVLDAARPVGQSHDPGAFMALGRLATETHHRYTGRHAEKSRKVWNSIFDEHNLDVIVTPTQFTPALTFAEMVTGSGKLDVLQPDGTYKEEAVANAIRANVPIMLTFKSFPVPKVVAPLGTDAEGRPISITLWGRSVDTEDLMYEEGAASYDIPFLHKAARVVAELQKAGIVKRVEPPTGSYLFGDGNDEL